MGAVAFRLMARPMRILFLTHHRRFKTFARSTPFARELVRLGHDVTLVCIADTGRLRFRSYSQDGVTYVETPDLLPGKLRSGWDPVSIFRRDAFLRGGSWDLIHAFESRPATIYPALRFRRRRPVPLVMDWIDWWGRGGLIYHHRPRWYPFLFGRIETYYEERFRRTADATTVISRALGRRAEGLGVDPGSIFCIPDGAETDFFIPRDPVEFRARYGVRPDALVLGFSALDVTSDADMVIEATALVARQRPDVQLLMTGNRPKGLDDIVEAHGAGAHVRHLGLLPYAELPEALSMVDIFLMPLRDTVSNRARWPHKICDYMSLGRPTITQPVGEIKDLFGEQRIGLLATEDPANLAENIIELGGDPARRGALGQQARRVAVERFAWPVLARRLEDCYAHAFKSQSGRTL